jgi:hypothetical protein
LINTAVSVLGTVILVTVGWYLLHGVPLTGVPDVEDISSITVTDENREVTVEREDFELMVNIAGLCNYKMGGKPNGSPIISVHYHLTNGETLVLSVNEDTVWWNNSSHAMKESKSVVSILNGLYFSQP